MNVTWEEIRVPSMQPVIILQEVMIANAILVMMEMDTLALVPK